ncbi:excisionase [Streptomyces phage phiSASD1]|uniref:Gp15 n=1 Tax=Streptomyces phage phiSASD1 TaxID=747763 RepID=D7NW84_9CAUD|nr:excisionase [Streptomyces phage phiSASD1]ADE43482.1 gp15 [Streptomyces phage phiSASD1]
MTAIRTRLTVAAGLVIISLTVVAFWLSYAHLHDVAASHGLGGSPARAWAWPATLDLFIVAGEIMMLVAALSHRKDLWAIGLTAAGSFGSIGLNVYGVGAGAPMIEYLVAAAPPSAALLAFGALMNQIHKSITGSAQTVDDQSLAVQDTYAEDTFSGPLGVVPHAVSPLKDVLADVQDEEGEEPEPDEDEEGEDLEVTPVYAATAKPTLKEISAAVEDILKERQPLSGRNLGEYFGVSARTGRRYLTMWNEGKEAAA